MFNISVQDTGDHPDYFISEIWKCLNSCLKSDPENVEEVRQKLARRLSQSGVMQVELSSSSSARRLSRSGVMRVELSRFISEVRTFTKM